MAKGWYVLSVFSGHENKVEKFIRLMMDEGTLSAVLDVKVPTEDVIKTAANNKKRIVKEKFLPGYILIEMDLPDRGWKEPLTKLYKVPSVMGILGQSEGLKPQPIRQDEAKGILQKAGEIKAEKGYTSTVTYKEDSMVRIVDGPFTSFTGKVQAVDQDKARLTVLVGIFGQETPVELDFNQVEHM